MTEYVTDFIGFVKELFPCISPYTEEGAQKAILNYADSVSKKGDIPLFNCFKAVNFEYLAQGDIFDHIPFEFIDEKGEEKTIYAKAILITNTCDADNDEYLTFAPFFEIKKLTNINDYDIRHNGCFKMLFFPDSEFDYSANLSVLKSFPKEIFNQAIKNGNIKKMFSLNTFGYYLFLTKLTVFFMRPEHQRTLTERV